VRAGGKRLRPLLVLVASGSAGGPRTTPLGEQALVRAAVAVELVHSATLVHDDLIDGARLRRGRPTVAATGGRQAAVATGDLLFSLAFAQLAKNDDADQLRALSDASSALAAGELLQREDAYAMDVDIARYLRRCELKTAALFEAACRLGALVAAQGSSALAEGLGAFARGIGLAFQLLDDVLDVSGPVERTGKARGTIRSAARARMKNSASSDMLAWVMRLRSPSSSAAARSSSSSRRSTDDCSKTPSRRDSHSGQRRTMRQWPGPSSAQSRG